MSDTVYRTMLNPKEILPSKDKSPEIPMYEPKEAEALIRKIVEQVAQCFHVACDTKNVELLLDPGALSSGIQMLGGMTVRFDGRNLAIWWRNSNRQFVDRGQYGTTTIKTANDLKECLHRILDEKVRNEKLRLEATAYQPPRLVPPLERV